MNQNPLNFNNKKDRNDFFIALAVIIFFGLLFWWLFTEKKPVEIPKVAKAEIVEVIEDVDTDGDGIFDKDDKCPNLEGIAVNNGCPKDSDGDGIYDINDKCPNHAGTLALKGCPTDSDGDGIHNGIDKCPELAGIKANYGCPQDTDGDGVYVVDDKCPNRPGLKSNDGCPKIKLEDTEKELLKTALRAVEFETASATLKASSTATLDKIVDLMKKYKAYKFAIKGHTDNQGDPEKNQTLSTNRAQAAKDYLVAKGIEAKRITARGYGSDYPVASNDTPAGRQSNRRVEFEPSY